MRQILILALAAASSAAQEPDSRSLALSLSRQSFDPQLKRAPAVAEERARQAAELAEKTGDPLLLASCLHNWAMLLREHRRYAQAEPLHRRALALVDAAHAKPRHVALALQTLAALLILDYRHAEAEPLLRRAAGLPLRQETPLLAALVLNSLGEVLYARGQDREAESTLKRARSAHGVIRPVPAEDFFDYPIVPGETKEKLLALILNNQGLALYRSGQMKTAEKCFRQCIDLYRRVPNPPVGAIGSPLANLGELLRFEKRYPEATDCLREALSIFQSKIGAETLPVCQVTNALGNIFLEQGNRLEARRHYQRALDICIQAAGESHPQTGVIVGNLAELERREGHTGQSFELFARSLQILERSLGADHPDLIATLAGQAALFRKLGYKREAALAESRRKAIQSRQGAAGMVSLEDLQNGR